MVLAGEKRLSLKHLGKDTSCAPYVDLDIVFLPGEHDLRCSVVPCRDVASHLRILNACETKVTDLQVAILVDEDVAGLQVSVNNTGGVDVFQPSLHIISVCPLVSTSLRLTNQYLIKEVLYELLFKRSRGQEAVQISSEEFCDKVAVRKVSAMRTGTHRDSADIHILEGRDEDVAEADNLGTISMARRMKHKALCAYVFVPKVFQ